MSNWFKELFIDEAKNVLESQDVSAIIELEKELEIERDRITNLATLQEGSTTGDAELQDIRVGFDGTVYPNAGEAVRAQGVKIEVETFEDEAQPVAFAMTRAIEDTPAVYGAVNTADTKVTLRVTPDAGSLTFYGEEQRLKKEKEPVSEKDEPSSISTPGFSVSCACLVDGAPRDAPGHQ